MKTLLLIVNPKAGRTRSSLPLFDAVTRFSQAGYLVRVFVTSVAGDTVQVASECGGQYDLVVCVGGDGTFNETVAGLMTIPADQRPPVGYLPAGSTNDFAASLHLPGELPMAAAVIASGRPHPLDVGQINERFFSYVASFGAFTKASYSAPQSTKNMMGHLAYVLEGIQSLDTLRPWCCTVTTEEEVFSGKFIFGAVCNSTSLGGLVKLDPSQVEMDDGRFELMLMQMPKNIFDLNQLVSGLSRMDYDTHGIIFRHVSSLTITSEENIPWSLDGEFFRGAPEVNIRCLGGAIRLVM